MKPRDFGLSKAMSARTALYPKRGCQATEEPRNDQNAGPLESPSRFDESPILKMTMVNLINRLPNEAGLIEAS